MNTDHNVATANDSVTSASGLQPSPFASAVRESHVAMRSSRLIPVSQAEHAPRKPTVMTEAVLLLSSQNTKEMTLAEILHAESLAA